MYQLPAVGCVYRDIVEENLKGMLRPVVEDLKMVGKGIWEL